MATLLFRCDGGPAIGLGHVVRCLALADELSRVHRCTVEFATRPSQIAEQMIANAGFHVHVATRSHPRTDEVDWLAELVRRRSVQMVIVDLRDGLDRSGLASLRSGGVNVTILDDSSDRRLAADLAFYPPMPQLYRLDWQEFSGQGYVGWQWVVLRSQFRGRSGEPVDGVPTILLSAGGSDPAGITLRLVDGLEQVEAEIDPVIVVGPAFQHSHELRTQLNEARREYRVRTSVANMADLMAAAHLAVISFGITAYELAAVGVPAIYVAISDDHAESAAAFDRAGLGVNLGIHECVRPENIARAVEDLLADPVRRWTMGIRARSLIDGKGTTRVAREIMRYLRRAGVANLQAA